jgi:hypothetical protein
MSHYKLLISANSGSSHTDLTVMSSTGQCGRFSGKPGFAASTIGATPSMDVGACFVEAVLLFLLADGLISSVGPY